MMTTLRKFTAALLSVLLLAPGLASAQRSFSQPELDRLLAPVALYPDSLLSQVLMAATYPADLAEAARWSRSNSHLVGDNAVLAAAGEDWDPSVLSLLAFPQLLQRMDENPEWTRSLGEAFLAQEPHVMDTVQQLRRRAHAAGHLRSDDRILVQPQGQVLAIAPAQPHVVYLPYYDPLVVYGPWWWPAYQPVYWAPWPGYVRIHRPGVSVAFWWGAPVRLSLGFFFGGVDWHHRQVRVVHVHNHYLHAQRHVHLAPGHWRHVVRRERVVVERRFIERPAVERHVVERPVIERRVAATPIAAPAAAPIVQAAPQRDRGERRDLARERREAQREPESRREPARVQAPAAVTATAVAPAAVTPPVVARPAAPSPVVAPPVVAPPVVAPPVVARPAVAALPPAAAMAAPTVQRAVERPTPRAAMPGARGEPRNEARNERRRQGADRS